MVLFSQGLWLDASQMCSCGFGLGVSTDLYKGKIVLVMGVVMNHLMQICCTDHWRRPLCASINEQSRLGGALFYQTFKLYLWLLYYVF